jgi:TetR/AcrR family transcriptional regulator, mexJK operon transcriptional repressor
MTTAPATRSERKHQAIIDAATELFLRDGFRDTTMDAIAGRAGVSKQTVYKHFADKRQLFSEIVLGTVDAAGDPVDEGSAELERSADLEADLRDLARRQLDAVLDPPLLALRRLVIGEVGRFPELGRAFYERGFGRSTAALANAFGRLADRGALDLDDPELAAAHFNWLILSAPVNRAMLLGEDGIPSAGELDRHVAAGVRAFLAAYRRND